MIRSPCERSTGGAWLGWTSHGDGIGAIADRRQTAIYRVAADDIVFRDYDYPPKIAQGRLALRMTPGSKTVGNLAKGRRILLRSADRIDEAEVVATTPFAAVPGQLEDHLFVDFAPAPVSPLGNTQLLANVAAASHGETQPLEALGHGNGGQSFQTFKLSRPNLTYLQTPSALDGTAALDVRVNGQQWKATPSFFGRGPREYLYTARQNDNGETYVTFGDGTTGARLPSGAMNVTATYRTGSGLQGIMTPNQLSIPLERPVGLRSVTNPLRRRRCCRSRDPRRRARQCAQFGKDFRSRRFPCRFRGDRDGNRRRGPRLCDLGVERARARRARDDRWSWRHPTVGGHARPSAQRSGCRA